MTDHGTLTFRLRYETGLNRICREAMHSFAVRVLDRHMRV